MGKKDPRVDALIAKAPEFAKPILTHFRAIVHEACPDVVEAIKWGNVSFEHQGIVCGIATFKEHCSYGFWKSSLLGIPIRNRVESLSDLPSKRELVSLVKRAAKMNEDGVKAPEEPRAKPDPSREVDVPDYFMKALRKNKKALVNFEDFAYSHKKEYVQWITEAKREETRQERIETALEWLAEGKPRNWKYMRK